MQLIHAPIHSVAPNAIRIDLKVDRLQLAKRRWRGIADDGQEFGFDLEHPLHDGSVFFAKDTDVYRIEQLPEPVIDVTLPSNPTSAARIGWLLGNLHFPVELHAGCLRVNDDPAVRQLLEREHIQHELTEGTFHPISGAHSHAH
jgi:urease accessory protein